MSTMTSLERLEAAVNFQSYDRPPFADNEWNEMLGDLVPLLVGCPVRLDRRYSDAERCAAIAASMDLVPWGHVYDHPRYPILGPIPSPREGERTVDRDGFRWVRHGFSEWVEARPFDDLPGLVAYLVGKAADARRAQPRLPVDFPARLAYARRMLPGTPIALPYLGAHLDSLYRLAGWELLAEVVTRVPEAIATYLDALADHTVALVHAYASHLPPTACPVALGAYSDIAWNGGLLLSPDALRLALLPAVRKIVAAYHEHGIKVVYHSEGDMRAFLPDLVAAGVDGINPLSPSEHMDPVEIRRLYPHLILWGGIDERAVLAAGTPDLVYEEVRRVVRGVGRGLILGSSGGVHPACPVDNLVAMIEALHSLGGC